jgi:hypothetical protein
MEKEGYNDRDGNQFGRVPVSLVLLISVYELLSSVHFIQFYKLFDLLNALILIKVLTRLTGFQAVTFLKI